MDSDQDLFNEINSALNETSKNELEIPTLKNYFPDDSVQTDEDDIFSVLAGLQSSITDIAGPTQEGNSSSNKNLINQTVSSNSNLEGPQITQSNQKTVRFSEAVVDDEDEKRKAAKSEFSANSIWISTAPHIAGHFSSQTHHQPLPSSSASSSSLHAFACPFLAQIPTIPPILIETFSTAALANDFSPENLANHGSGSGKANVFAKYDWILQHMRVLDDRTSSSPTQPPPPASTHPPHHDSQIKQAIAIRTTILDNLAQEMRDVICASPGVAVEASLSDTSAVDIAENLRLLNALIASNWIRPALHLTTHILANMLHFPIGGGAARRTAGGALGLDINSQHFSSSSATPASNLQQQQPSSNHNFSSTSVDQAFSLQTLQIWTIRWALLIRLQMYSVVDQELIEFRHFHCVNLYAALPSSTSSTFSSSSQSSSSCLLESRVPFSMRLIHAVLPHLLITLKSPSNSSSSSSASFTSSCSSEEALLRLGRLQSVCEQILFHLEKGDSSSSNCCKVWRLRIRRISWHKLAILCHQMDLIGALKCVGDRLQSLFEKSEKEKQRKEEYEDKKEGEEEQEHQQKENVKEMGVLHETRARLLLQLGDVQNARACFQRALDTLRSTRQICSKLTTTADKTEEKKEKKDNEKKQENENDMEFEREMQSRQIFYDALLCIANGSFVESKRLFEQCSGMNASNSARASNNAAIACLFLGNLAEAVRLLEELVMQRRVFDQSALANLSTLYKLGSNHILQKKRAILQSLASVPGDFIAEPVLEHIMLPSGVVGAAVVKAQNLTTTPSSMATGAAMPPLSSASSSSNSSSLTAGLPQSSYFPSHQSEPHLDYHPSVQENKT